MDDQVIVVQCLEISDGGSSKCWFQILSLRTKELVSEKCESFFEAEQWAMKQEASLVDKWSSNEVFIVEDIVTASANTGLAIVVAIAWIRNRIAPDHLQPKCRFWIIDRNNRIIAMKASLKDASGFISRAEHLADENPTGEQRKLNPPGTRRGG